VFFLLCGRDPPGYGISERLRNAGYVPARQGFNRTQTAVFFSPLKRSPSLFIGERLAINMPA
jgi:hypothetical protein